MVAAFTLETTQALFMHENANDLAIQWNIFMQIPDALQGKYAGVHLDSIIFSWVVLTSYVVVASLKKWAAKGWVEEVLAFFCHGMIAFDGFANWQYLEGHEWYYRVGFVLMVVGVLMFFGRLSIQFIKMALGGL